MLGGVVPGVHWVIDEIIKYDKIWSQQQYEQQQQNRFAIIQFNFNTDKDYIISIMRHTITRLFTHLPNPIAKATRKSVFHGLRTTPSSCLLHTPLSHPFSTSPKLTKQQIRQSSYSQLVDKIAHLYDYKEYKIPSALSLLEVHHQFRIFRPGDWVLDIGAGPNWAWTDLAAKLVRTKEGHHRVISNDLKPCSQDKDSCIVHVTGNFMEEPVRTKIAMNLLERQLNTILIDATGEYTGDQQADSQNTIQIFVEALQFSQHYLKKGGTIVIRVLESSRSLQLEKQCQFFFHEVSRYRSSNFRADSPTFFYVLKGYMITDNFTAVGNLLKQYQKAKSTGQKVQLIEEYRKKYKWDPVDIITNQAKQKIVQLRNSGKKNKQIANMYENDPYIKAGEILTLLDKLEDKKSSPVTKAKARKQLLYGKEGVKDFDLPETQEEFADELYRQVEKLDQEDKQLREKARLKKLKAKGIKVKPKETKKDQNAAPLAADEVYMKSTKINQKGNKKDGLVQLDPYEPQDLYGYNPDNPQSPINHQKPKTPKQRQQANQLQMEKIMKSFPQIREALKKNKNFFNEKSVEDIEQQLRQKFSSEFGPETKEEQKSKQDKEAQEFQQDLQDQEQQKFMKTGAYVRNDKKYKDLGKKFNPEADFDFDKQKMDDIVKDHDRRERDQQYEKEFDRESKVEYLKTKPRKSERPINKKKSQSAGSYFKTKNKNKP